MFVGPVYVKSILPPIEIEVTVNVDGMNNLLNKYLKILECVYLNILYVETTHYECL